MSYAQQDFLAGIYLEYNKHLCLIHECVLYPEDCGKYLNGGAPWQNQLVQVGCYSGT